MQLAVLSWFCSSLLASVSGGKLTEAEVNIEVLSRPFICRRKTKYGDMLMVHHDGFFENGTMFHSSRNSGDKQPMWFTLGIRQVLKGWDIGLQDMCAGEKRKLIIPPSLAYGKEGKDSFSDSPLFLSMEHVHNTVLCSGKIPPESTLTFIVELLEIRNGPRSHESFQEMDLNDDWRLSKHEVKEYLKMEYERYGYPPNDTLHENMMEEVFAREDENNDGFISSREFTYKHDEL
ncbi:peptidyl-prolyl cis-trans isomerase FKBP14-like isoform X1 [Melanotaenia boesemani]|uniref:peptidyl-prolyl cis-trans isomerase FKBP14-like isoform X1 n=1 Tax=Melanotaenia boesemani TaxID=1250792 RepID=UPI001C04A9AF|nr:peptidyl-prolyl cis-trans isomerase FKBP14-like isoform X1 [Melanotaenia boesemani]